MERDALASDFVGKTITGFDGSCWNVWKFSFSDGTAIAIEAEGHSVCGPGLQVCEQCAEGFGAPEALACGIPADASVPGRQDLEVRDPPLREGPPRGAADDAGGSE